ncbi:MAG: alpha/beta fold hydrolase [Phycisphaerae bacterium]
MKSVCSGLIAGFFAPLALSADERNRAEAQTPELEKRTLTARDGSTIEYDFGRIEVPENRTKPDSRTISIAFARIHSPLESHGPPVFMIAGGPGGASVEMVTKLAKGGGSGFLKMLGGDLVGIDQRGIGESTPNLASPVRYEFEPTAPGDPEKMLAIVKRVGKIEAKRWRDQGVDLDGYTTSESADDMDAVRRALGYDKIVLWGASYGSHLAMATLRKHEAHVSRAVLIVPEGPDHTYKLPSAAQRAVEQLHAKVAEDETMREVVPDFLGTLRTVLERLEKEPVYVETNGQRVGVSKFDVQRWAANYIGFRDGMQRVPAAVQRMSDGDFSDIARELMNDRIQDGVGSAMPIMMDGASGATTARRQRIADEAKTCLLADTVNFPFPGIAEAWNAPDLGDEFRGPLKAIVPILFIAGELDSRTPVSNARELMPDLPNAHLIVVKNAGHDLRWIALHEAIGDFLAGRTVTITESEEPPLVFEIP